MLFARLWCLIMRATPMSSKTMMPNGLTRRRLRYDRNGVSKHSRWGCRWRARRDSNPRHLVPKTSALSTELRAQTFSLISRMARAAGLEPTTYGLEGRCSIQLSYARPGQNYSIVMPSAQLWRSYGMPPERPVGGAEQRRFRAIGLPGSPAAQPPPAPASSCHTATVPWQDVHE